jgi:hypothetical protein
VPTCFDIALAKPSSLDTLSIIEAGGNTKIYRATQRKPSVINGLHESL